jgi:hypothetical protein
MINVASENVQHIHISRVRNMSADEGGFGTICLDVEILGTTHQVMLVMENSGQGVRPTSAHLMWNSKTPSIDYVAPASEGFLESLQVVMEYSEVGREYDRLVVEAAYNKAEEEWI